MDRRRLLGAGLCTSGAQCLKQRYVGQECYFLRGCHGQIHNPHTGQSRCYESTDRWQIGSVFTIEVNYRKNTPGHNNHHALYLAITKRAILHLASSLIYFVF